MTLSKAFQSTKLLRQLGSVEHFFHAVNQLYGSCQVTAMYKLSQPISIANLNTVADTIRSRHRILQTTIDGNWKQSSMYYLQADHLNTDVRQSHHSQHPHNLMHKTTISREDSLKSLAKQGLLYDTQTENTETLPWSLTLSKEGDHVIFSAPHSITDGISLDIIGSEIIHSLNGHNNSNLAKEIPQPVESLFGTFPLRNRVKAYLEFIKRPFSNIKCGLDISNVQNDWTDRKMISLNGDVKIQDMSSFYKKCKEKGVSLNSGMVSAFYEAVARSSAFKTQGKCIPLCIPINARRRLDKDKGVKDDSVGVYIGTMSISENTEEDKWEERAKSIQTKIHTKHMVNHFVESWIPMKMVAKMGGSILPKMANDNHFGRSQALCFSNLGKTSLINDANDMYKKDKNNDGIYIEKFWFDESGCGLGFFVTVHMATVGDNVTWCIHGFEPFMSADDLNQINLQFKRMLTSK